MHAGTFPTDGQEAAQFGVSLKTYGGVAEFAVAPVAAFTSKFILQGTPPAHVQGEGCPAKQGPTVYGANVASKLVQLYAKPCWLHGFRADVQLSINDQSMGKVNPVILGST